MLYTDTEKQQLKVNRNPNGQQNIEMACITGIRIYKDHISLSPEHKIASWEVNIQPEEFGKWSAEHNIPFIDTSTWLEEFVARGVHPYFIDDVHWNQLGHETAARVIGKYLSSEGLFPFNKQ